MFSCTSALHPVLEGHCQLSNQCIRHDKKRVQAPQLGTCHISSELTLNRMHTQRCQGLQCVFLIIQDGNKYMQVSKKLFLVLHLT